MRNFIAAVSLAAFADVLAYAGESYAPPEASNGSRIDGGNWSATRN